MNNEIQVLEKKRAKEKIEWEIVKKKMEEYDLKSILFIFLL